MTVAEFLTELRNYQINQIKGIFGRGSWMELTRLTGFPFSQVALGNEEKGLLSRGILISPRFFSPALKQKIKQPANQGPWQATLTN